MAVRGREGTYRWGCDRRLKAPLVRIERRTRETEERTMPDQLVAIIIDERNGVPWLTEQEPSTPYFNPEYRRRADYSPLSDINP